MITLFRRIKDFSIIMPWTSAGGGPPPLLLLIAAAGGITVATTGELSDGCCGDHVRSRPRSKWQRGGGLPPSLWLRTDIKEKQEPVH